MPRIYSPVKVLFAKNVKTHIHGVCEGATCIQWGKFVWHVQYVSQIELRDRAELVPLTLMIPFDNLTYLSTRDMAPIRITTGESWRGRKECIECRAEHGYGSSPPYTEACKFVPHADLCSVQASPHGSHGPNRQT